jgi:hypothetical protein
MTSDAPDFSDLFEESSLWQLYRKSPSLWKSRFNTGAVGAAVLLLAAFAVLEYLGTADAVSTRPINFLELFGMWATNGIAFAGTILGFLIAGFAVFCTLLRPSTLIALQKVRRPGEEHHELKLILLAFVGVFAQYIAFLMWCVVFSIIGGKNGPLDLLASSLGASYSRVAFLVTLATFVIWGAWWIVLILKLKSFIYNLYQSLLVGITDAVE